MAVRIRMTRLGRCNRPFYRIGAYDSRSPRDGRCLENLGWYNPVEQNVDQQLKVDIQRTEHWLSVGALPTPKVAYLLKKAGIKLHKEPIKKDKPNKKEVKAEPKVDLKNKKKNKNQKKKKG
ncbi:MAG: 30S ribosomal protein S16 [Planctomycetes bacterium]|nr:30S ribosomal protein S16 [Planctomycetota bacterium]HNZ65852.1 30S ribosomal protein S16 [Planctomycetota bacterium]HON45834.1 30S ribosomal protein S16 [Planctomycetota bacterium]HPY75716.1 30S ribosomal protein S16 [Planctomycetota bacterium]HQB01265.1 30S ribosomal protein S16 [Planctomycetota bacterium]